MKKKKNVLLGSVAITLIISIGFALSVDQKTDYEMKAKQNNQIAIYIQDAEGNYQVNNTDMFPMEGYVLNIEKSACQNGSTLTQDEITKVINLSTSHSDSCTLYFDKEFFNIPEAVNAILNNQPVKAVQSGNPMFANVAITDEGVYAMADDYGTSYYFRGAVENNYVQFANKFWRIIRVNGDGSVRMIYDGPQAYANGTNSTRRQALSDVKFNGDHSVFKNDVKYVGYMYGPEGETASISYEEATMNTESSNIKIHVDNWYKANIVDAGFSKYVSDTIFCNDRSIASAPKIWWTSEGTNIGFGDNITAYGAFSRFLTTSAGVSSTLNPRLSCPNKNDAFTVSDTMKGNGALTYPVGLITADEIVVAGSGKYSAMNQNYYLYKGSWYWSLTPSFYSSGATIFFLYNGNLGTAYSPTSGNVAPVINISSEYAKNFKGTGTMANPYTIE